MKLALFDLDGTLIDSETGILASIEYALTKLGAKVPPREELLGWIGPPLRATFPRVLGDDPARIEHAVESYRERYSTIGWREHVVYAGIGEAIEALAADGITLAVVTSKAALYAGRIVESLPFGAHFARVYAVGPDSAHSEKASMIARAMADFGMPANETAMVGDRHFDIEGARANGVLAIGVTWGFGSREELDEAGADIVVADAAELPAALRAATTT